MGLVLVYQMVGLIILCAPWGLNINDFQLCIYMFICMVHFSSAYW